MKFTGEVLVENIKWPKSIIGSMTKEEWDSIDDNMVVGCGSFEEEDE